MDNLLQGLSHISVYLDDILVTGRSNQEHLHNLDNVLTRLKKAGISAASVSSCYHLCSVS